MTLSVYISASFPRRLEARACARELERLGLTVCSTWLTNPIDTTPEADLSHAAKARLAEQDRFDLDCADLLCLINDPPDNRQGLGLEITPADEDTAQRADEEWRLVQKSSCGYQVSSWGRIKGASGDVILGSPMEGYWYVKPDGKNGARIAIHQIVLAAFIGPCPKGMEVDHKDGDRANNSLSNLEYVTHQENIRRAVARGGWHRPGEKNSHAVLTIDQVREIRKRYECGERNKTALGREYGVTYTAIYQIVNRRTWSHVDPPVNDNKQHYEMGIADALRMPVIVVGHRSHVFTHAANVIFCPDWMAAKAYILGLTVGSNGRVIAA